MNRCDLGQKNGKNVALFRKKNLKNFVSYQYSGEERKTQQTTIL